MIFIKTNSKENCSLIAKTIGGQAVIEGVMMKNESYYALAVRNIKTKNIVIEKKQLKNNYKNKITKLPFIRGVFSFLDSMITGIEIIGRSATLSGLEETEQKTKLDTFLENKLGEKLQKYILIFSLCVSFILSIAIFIVLPIFIASKLNFGLSSLGLSVLEGLIRVLIFLCYIFLVSCLKDVKRIFMYHGAEHKTITCFEKGESLTIENVKKHSRFHKRCGTSFLVIVMIVSIFIFMFLNTNNILLRVISRVILVPVIAGISYEIIRLAGKYDSLFFKIVSTPGIALQKITTKEPTEDMIEVAIKSLNAILKNTENEEQNA